MCVIKIKDLFFSREKKIIFDKVSLDIQEKKITAIMGPSGCGKTTLLRLITNQLNDYTGIIEIKKKNIKELNRSALDELRKDIGILFQNGALFSDLSVYDNVAFPIREHTSLSESVIKDLVLMKLQSVGLRNAGFLMPSQLSLGMAKRAALARTIALDPSIIMYDEPFSGQDPISMSLLMNLITLLNKFAKITTVIVSHDIHETLAIADYVYIINDKKIIAEGVPEYIKSISNVFVQSFINMEVKYYHEDYVLTEGYEKDLFIY